jgi:tetratricopeptide (TPR) repeat protein
MAQCFLILVLLSGGQLPAGVGAPLPVPPDELAAVLRQALADFDAAVAAKDPGGPEAQRLFRQSLAGFQSLRQSGVRSAGLYYDIGNTYLRLGEVGQAVVQYRRALRLAPGDERIVKNLEAARRLCRVQISRPVASEFVRTLFFWHFETSLAGRLRVGLAVYVLFWLLLFVRLFAFRGQPAYAWLIRATAALALIVGASVAWDLAVQTQRQEGVVVADSVVLRKGNGEYYDPLLEQTLSEGVEFRLIETREDVQGAPWYQVELPDGKKGWLRADQADVI